MTSSRSGPDQHPGRDLLASYATGAAGAAVWSVEAHLGACGPCRSAVSAHADPEQLARNKSVLFVRAALPEGGRVRGLLCRRGFPDHLLRLIGATPSLRRPWLLSVIGVLAIVTGEAASAAHGRIGNGAVLGPAVSLNAETLAPFLLLGPLLVLAGVAAAFLPMFDPAYRLAVAAPISGVTLVLARAVSALVAALILVVAAAFLVPGPGWLPVGLLLPSLALCTFALAAATALDARTAAVAAGALWALPAMVLTADHLPLLLVERRAQLACLALFVAAALVLLARRNRFDWGWTR
jgi:hypothetical protein